MPVITAPISSPVMLQKAKHDTAKWVIGSIILALGGSLWASWFLIQARIGKYYPYQYSSTAMLSFCSAVQSAILCAIIERPNSWTLKGPLQISSIVYAVSEHSSCSSSTLFVILNRGETVIPILLLLRSFNSSKKECPAMRFSHQLLISEENALASFISLPTKFRFM